MHIILKKMTFLNKKEVLTFEEMYKLCSGFIELGIKKIRITGGEPLVRKGIIDFFEMLKLAILAYCGID